MKTIKNLSARVVWRIALGGLALFIGMLLIFQAANSIAAAVAGKSWIQCGDVF